MSTTTRKQNPMHDYSVTAAAAYTGHDFGLTDPQGPDTLPVYGNPAVKTRARNWAVANMYLLVTGVSRCPHGLTFVQCTGSRCHEVLDHGNIWAPVTPEGHLTGNLFVLAHNYGTPARLDDYADVWGLTVGTLECDAWYGGSSEPVRLTPRPEQLWPLERAVAGHLAVFPAPRDLSLAEGLNFATYLPDGASFLADMDPELVALLRSQRVTTGSTATRKAGPR